MKPVSELLIASAIALMPAFCRAEMGTLPITSETTLTPCSASVSSACWYTLHFARQEGESGELAGASPTIQTSTAVDSRLTQSRRLEAKPGMGEWKLSLLALAAAHSADTATSWNKRELNPLLSPGSGAFGLQTLAIKWG